MTGNDLNFYITTNDDKVILRNISTKEGVRYVQKNLRNYKNHIWKTK